MEPGTREARGLRHRSLSGVEAMEAHRLAREVVGEVLVAAVDRMLAEGLHVAGKVAVPAPLVRSWAAALLVTFLSTSEAPILEAKALVAKVPFLEALSASTVAVVTDASGEGPFDATHGDLVRKWSRIS